MESIAGSYFEFMTNRGTSMWGATSSGSVQASPGLLPALAAAATQEASRPAVLFMADAIHSRKAGHSGLAVKGGGEDVESARGCSGLRPFAGERPRSI